MSKVKKVSKWQELKEAMKNPPQERLCLINANGYKIGILAILVISVILFQTIIWYISIIFLVQLVNNWVGYKREMNQYNAIVSARKAMGVYQKIEDDPSYTRRRFRLISEELSDAFKYVIAAVIAVPIVIIFDIGSLPILDRLFIMLIVFVLFIIVMLFPVYWIAKIKRSLKNG